MIYSGSGSSSENWEFRIRVQIQNKSFQFRYTVLKHEFKVAVSQDFFGIFFHGLNPFGILMNMLKWFFLKIPFHRDICEICDTPGSAQVNTAQSSVADPYPWNPYPDPWNPYHPYLDPWNPYHPYPDPWNPYHFPGSRSGSASKIGWIRNLNPYQMIRIRIQLKSWKTVNNFNLFTLI